jgi:signal transduction histidine kinase
VRRPAFGIRARTTLTATVVVGLALALASAALVLTTRYALRTSIEAAASTRASDVALLARSGSLPAVLPGRGESLLVQVVSGSGVMAASPSIQGEPPLATVTVSPGESRNFVLPAVSEKPDTQGAELNVEPSVPFVVTAQGVRTPSGPMTVLVAASLSPLEDVSDALVPLLLAGVPVVLLVVAATTWALTGLALRPVDSIRKEAESISSSALDRRLPVPHAHDEIHDLTETMNRMLDRIEAASIAQRRFTANASHELKSPIASIRTMLEVAMHDPAGVDVPGLVEDLLAEDRRLELLVADLLLLGQSDEGALRLGLGRVYVASLVGEEINRVAQPHGPRIDTGGVEPVEVNADAARLRQLFRNLLDNAVRHARGGIWVTTREDGGDLVLTVSDDGAGIPLEDRERVFDRFIRLDESRSRSDGGTGLGLSVCRVIVIAHGGSIRVVEPAHGGATLEARIPVAGPLPLSERSGAAE